MKCNHIPVRYNNDVKLSKKCMNGNHAMFINVQWDSLFDIQLQRDEIIKYWRYDEQYGHNMSLKLLDVITKQLNTCEIVFNISPHNNVQRVHLKFIRVQVQG